MPNAYRRLPLNGALESALRELITGRTLKHRGLIGSLADQRNSSGDREKSAITFDLQIGGILISYHSELASVSAKAVCAANVAL